MVHSDNIIVKSNITLADFQDVNVSETYEVSYVDFEGKMVKRKYVRSKNNKKE
tara:strand:- start:401 stop:559 length:159 start_codon:yes stop_codon:yes gene_type:complete